MYFSCKFEVTKPHFLLKLPLALVKFQKKKSLLVHDFPDGNCHKTIAFHKNAHLILFHEQKHSFCLAVFSGFFVCLTSLSTILSFNFVLLSNFMLKSITVGEIMTVYAVYKFVRKLQFQSLNMSEMKNSRMAFEIIIIWLQYLKSP